MTSEIRRVAAADPEFPSGFHTIADPPTELWVRGTVGTDPAVAIVGTRRATSYGLGLARSMGRAVAAAGWSVVSGLARGVDGSAHRGCLDVGGAGVAVLGSGVDVWYPPEHRELGEALIATGGAVISEYPPGTTPEPWRFPARNRLISALAAVVVVCEAAEKGGALITARLAAEQGREVFAVPGDVSRATSVGTNLLIRDGAVPVLGPDDLIEALSLVLGPPRQGEGGIDDLGLLIPPDGATVEQVIEANGGSASEVLVMLGRLEADGRVKLDGGLVFALG